MTNNYDQIWKRQQTNNLLPNILSLSSAVSLETAFGGFFNALVSLFFLNQGHSRSVPRRLISMCGLPSSSILCHSTFLVRTISKKGIASLKSLKCHASKENVSTTHHSSSIWVVDLEQSQQQQQQKIRRRERRPCHVRNAFTVTRREVLLQQFHVLRGRVQSNNWFSFHNTSPQWNYFLLSHRSLRGQQEIIE